MQKLFEFFKENQASITVVLSTAATAIAAAVAVCSKSKIFKDEPEDQKYFASLKRIQNLRAQARKLGCSAIAEFWSADLHDLQKCYDGVGPRTWTILFRKLATTVIEKLEFSVLIHDFSKVYAEKNFVNFLSINVDFVENCAKESYEMKNWKLFWCGFLLAVLSTCFGYGQFLKTTVETIED